MASSPSSTLTHRITAPLLEMIERDRYYRRRPRTGPTSRRPGLVVDLSRRMERDDLLRCFANVVDAGPDLAGGRRRCATSATSAFLVSGPRRDIWIIGCPEEIRPASGGSPSVRARR